MAEKAYVEMSPLSQDGEDMLKAIILPYGGKLIKCYPDRDCALLSLPGPDSVDQLRTLSGYDIRVVDKPGDNRQSQSKNDSMEPLVTQTVDASFPMDDGSKSLSPTPNPHINDEGSTHTSDKKPTKFVSDRAVLHESDAFYLLCNVNFFGPAMCMFLMGYTLFCLTGIF